MRWVPFPEDELARLPAAVVLTDRAGEPLRVKLAAVPVPHGITRSTFGR